MILLRNQIGDFCRDLKAQNKKIVFTNGCFDILHLGHVTYLKQARALGDFLFVGLNSDSSVKKLKGENRPIQTEKDRAEILSSLKSVDAVSIFEEETPLTLIKKIWPDVLVKGGDWPIDKIIGSKEVIEAGGKVLSLPFVEGHSSSDLIDKLKKL